MRAARDRLKAAGLHLGLRRSTEPWALDLVGRCWHHCRMIRTAPARLFAVALAMAPAAVLSADMDLKMLPRDAPASTPAAGSVFAPPEPGCLEWTDGCRVCQQPPAGEVFCSNIGMACTPQALRCTRR
jgi:hypothetical protein